MNTLPPKSLSPNTFPSNTLPLKSLVITDLVFGFGDPRRSTSSGEPPLFNHLTLTIAPADSPTVILGVSGCGKTTLLRLAAGLLTPWSGTIVCDTAAFVFQEPRLLPWLRVWENVALPLKHLIGAAQARDQAHTFLGLVSLADKADAYPAALSGGQRQRASIARAFAYPAPVLFMDEPFQSLDIPLRLELMAVTLQLLEKEPRLLVAVTHDPREAIVLGRRILVLTPQGIVFDEQRDHAAAEGTANQEWETRLLHCLQQSRHHSVE